MSFEEITKCKLGTVLMKSLTRRPAVLVDRQPAPLYNISVQYLDGDQERIEGCNPENFEKGILRNGLLLLEHDTKRRAILLEDSAGPLVSLQFLTGEKEERSLCEPKGTKRHWRAAFVIAPAPEKTAARTTT